MYKKRPENFGDFTGEVTPDTSKEVPTNDREKFIAAIRLEGETTGLWSHKANEALAIIKELNDALKRKDHDALERCTLAIAENSLEQINLLTNQYKKCANLFPDELSGLRRAVEEVEQERSQPTDDTVRRLQSLTDEELEKFTV